MVGWEWQENGNSSFRAIVTQERTVAQGKEKEKQEPVTREKGPGKSPPGHPEEASFLRRTGLHTQQPLQEYTI